MTTNPADLALGITRQVGRYFSLVSGTTSLLLVGYTSALLATGAPAHRPAIARLTRSVGELDLGSAAVLAVLVLTTGLVLHPLQFATTQLLEGYWGTSRRARQAMARSIRRHFRRWYRLEQILDEASHNLRQIDDLLTKIHEELEEAGPDDPEYDQLDVRRNRELEKRIPHAVDQQQSGIAVDGYPENEYEIMPTRLGNALRRYERRAGAPYGLDAVVVMPYLDQVAAESEREYLADTRSSMDLQVRLVVVWLLCTLIGTVAFWRFDVWLLIPLCTWALALLSYRSAVSAATSYGAALGVVVALARGELYARLRLPQERTLEAEARRNVELNKALAGDSSDLVFDVVRGEPSQGDSGVVARGRAGGRRSRRASWE